MKVLNGHLPSVTNWRQTGPWRPLQQVSGRSGDIGSFEELRQLWDLGLGLALAVRPAGLAEVSRVNGAPQARPAQRNAKHRQGRRGQPGQWRRSGPLAVTTSRLRCIREGDGLAVLLAGAAPGRYGGDRRRPVTGKPCAAAAAP